MQITVQISIAGSTTAELRAAAVSVGSISVVHCVSPCRQAAGVRDGGCVCGGQKRTGIIPVQTQSNFRSI